MVVDKATSKLEIEVEGGSLSMDELEELHEQILIGVSGWSKTRGGITVGEGDRARRLRKLTISHDRSGLLRKSVKFDEDGQPEDEVW